MMQEARNTEQRVGADDLTNERKSQTSTERQTGGSSIRREVNPEAQAAVDHLRNESQTWTLTELAQQIGGRGTKTRMITKVQDAAHIPTIENEF